MYIIDAKRTPLGKFLGSLSSYSAPELTLPLFQYFLATYPFLKTKTDEVIIGNVLSAGLGMNPARIAAYKGGVSHNVPSYTLNHVCASGLSSVISGIRAIKCGDAHLILAGGMESMSQAPYVLPHARTGFLFGEKPVIDTLENDGLTCSLTNQSMGQTAEFLAKTYDIDRKAQDAFAYSSHKKAISAQNLSQYTNNILAIGKQVQDEGPREDTSLLKLSKLQTVFKTPGFITAGNASSIADGAALMLVASQEAVEKYHFTPQAKISDYASVGLHPKRMGMGAQKAISQVLKKNNLTIHDIDVFEINEAFAVQVLCVIKKLEIPLKKVNIYGGAIALGHPLAMSGTRIIMNAVTALKQTGGKRAIVSACVGGGQGVAMLIENV